MGVSSYVTDAIHGLMSLFDWELLQGNFAEVGVCEGHSSNMIVTFIPNGRMFYLYDTFCGIPYHDERYDNFHRKGDISRSRNLVEAKMVPYMDRVKIISGIFPQSIGDERNDKFCFANIDVDVYQSTKDCLEFFYPRMPKGGLMMIQDDYTHQNTRGVAIAADEFIADKPENWKIHVCIGYFVKE